MDRAAFREAVFARDHKSLCLLWSTRAKMLITSMERRLWPDGGYILENGATLCGPCHVKAEQTLIRPNWLRVNIGLPTVLPPHLYDDQEYDKWGNPYIAIDRRMRGELFDDESVQKALAPVLHEFSDRIKYPRTYHLPWSPGATSDDRIMDDLSELEGHDVIVTVKMDGEQTTIYPDGYCHARSIDSGGHPSRDWVKALAGRVGPQLPSGWRICGENLWAKHSIYYTDLPSYFLMFSMWDGLTCLGWEETVEWAQMLDLHTVQRAHLGTFKPDWWRNLPAPVGREGYVVRRADSFHYRDFRKKVGKYVRASHVHTHGHWMREQITRNLLLTSRTNDLEPYPIDPGASRPAAGSFLR
jgi:hypothetical protein